MKKYLVIGNPIEHSLSPKLHNHWIKVNKLDAIYEKKKLNALESHKSQYLSTMGITEGNETKGLKDFRERIREELIAFGDLTGKGMAEGFKRITEL